MQVSTGTVGAWAWLQQTFAWSDALVLAVGAGTVTAAWVAILQAKKARGIAAGAATSAKTANKLAAAANALAEKANATGEGANEIAEEANRIARGANTLAQEANDLFKQQSEREIERHDAHWDGEFVEPGVYRLTNRGNDTAYKVIAVVVYGDERCRQEEDSVPGGQSIDFDLPSALKEYEQRKAQMAALAREVRDHERAQRRLEEEHRSGWGGLHLPMEGMTKFHLDTQMDQIQSSTVQVAEQVWWETRRGTPKRHEDTIGTNELGGDL